MNKLLLSAAITAAIFAGQAQAALLVTAGVPNITDALTQTNKEVWISGSSAATPFVEKSIAADCTGSIYKYSNSTTDFTWVCNSSIAAGTINIVHKRDGGGSVTGVKSALASATPSLAATYLPTYWVTSSLNTATCLAAVTSNGVSVIPCTPTAASPAQHNADIDLADVDGAQFEIAANGGVANASSLTGTGALATQIFGIVVNTRLYAAMQVASVAAGKIATSCISTSIVAGQNNGSFNFPTDNTDACQPSLTTAQLSALLGAGGRATDWYNLYFGGDALASIPQSLVAVQNTADQPTNTNVHYCSRTAGSGTLAAINIKLENQCSKTNEAIATASSQTISPETDAVAGNQKIVHSMSGSGDLENCLEGLNDGALKSTFTPYPAMTNTSGPRWAIGIMGLDRNSTVAKKYRYIKIDGIAPTAANVVNGKYKLWAELVNLAATSTNPLAVDILANLGSASQITALNVTHPFGLSGFLGTATNVNFLPTYDVAIAPGTLIQAAFDAARPVNPWTHASATGNALNHCRTPSIPAGATRAIPAFN
jgi:hypothetical protein